MAVKMFTAWKQGKTSPDVRIATAPANRMRGRYELIAARGQGIAPSEYGDSQ